MLKEMAIACSNEIRFKYLPCLCQAMQQTVLPVLGGRFKKEVVLDGQSYLLLIRDEGGLPEMQVLLQR